MSKYCPMHTSKWKQYPRAFLGLSKVSEAVLLPFAFTISLQHPSLARITESSTGSWTSLSSHLQHWNWQHLLLGGRTSLLPVGICNIMRWERKRERVDGKTWFQAHIVEQLIYGNWIMGIGPREPKCAPLCVRHFFEHLQMACTKTFTAELMDVSRLWGLNEK